MSDNAGEATNLLDAVVDAASHALIPGDSAAASSMAVMPRAIDEFEAEDSASDEEVAILMNEGIEKRLTIVHRPSAGNTLYFYDHNLRLIRDALAMRDARRIYFTNAFLGGADSKLKGLTLLDRVTRLFGQPSYRSSLRLEYPGGSYTFTDEASFWLWSGNTAAILESGRAYIS